MYVPALLYLYVYVCVCVCVRACQGLFPDVRVCFITLDTMPQNYCILTELRNTGNPPNKNVMAKSWFFCGDEKRHQCLYFIFLVRLQNTKRVRRGQKHQDLMQATAKHLDMAYRQIHY